jgi:hypothetical protein
MKRLVTWIVLAVFGMVAVGCTMEQPRPTAQAYPQYRQTADTQAEDSADCSAWASDQTGYRPSSTAQGAGIGAAVGALGGIGWRRCRGCYWGCHWRWVRCRKGCRHWSRGWWCRRSGHWWSYEV